MLKVKKLKKIFGEKLKEHIVLRDYTSMKVGGVADYFLETENIEDLITAVIAAREDEIPFIILGWGSNVLVSDYGFGGLVIRNATKNISILPDKSQAIVDSGVGLSNLILKVADSDLGGMENLFGIPGTVGGAIYGNAGAYGTEIFDYVKSVTMLSANNKLITKDKKWFEVKYRSTKLKRNEKNEYIILTVIFQFAKNKKEHLIENISKIKKERSEKLSGLCASCGSVFKNPKSGKSYDNVELAKKQSAGFLLESVNAKKMNIGEAKVFEKHANIVHNTGNARAAEVRALIEQMKDAVRENKGINLEEEIEYVGQWD